MNWTGAVRTILVCVILILLPEQLPARGEPLSGFLARAALGMKVGREPAHFFALKISPKKVLMCDQERLSAAAL